MTRQPPSNAPAGPAAARPDVPREDRLKAALKANMARRKAQARARAAQADGRDDTDNNDKE
jgi:hypothetical protein